MRLDGKVALISGGARGMGAAEARLFAREGAKVAIADVLEPEGRQLEAQINETGGQAIFIHLDVTSEAQWQKAIATTVSRFGKLNVLVNNAGIGSYGKVEDKTVEEWDHVMAVNATGVFLDTKHAIPEMRKAGGGSIINISSQLGMVAMETVSPEYHASKGAVRIFTKAAAIQYAKDKIRVNSVPLREISTGGPGKDGIRPIDKPVFVPASDPPPYMRDDEPVVSLELHGEARAYPLAILIGHEIVNDTVGDVPVTITYCPLCNSAVVFDRRLGGLVLDFGTTGNLRNSDLVMWDRQTESWWQQITGEAIVGELTGSRLTFVPAQVISWADFRAAYPEGLLLIRDTGSLRDYDRPPYGGYDLSESRPFLFRGAIDPRLNAVERVLTLDIGGEAVAYPFALLAEYPVVNDTVGGQPVVVFYTGGTLTPFPDADILGAVSGLGSEGYRREAERLLRETPREAFMPSRPVGSAAAYDPRVDGQRLTFAARDGLIVDEQTGSVWNILGQAVSGPLQGTQLASVLHGNHFWFAWAAFHPDTAVRTADALER